MALPFAGPPGIPAERAHALQAGFMAMCGDPAFVEEAGKLGMSIERDRRQGDPRAATRTAATPKDVIARYSAIGGERK